MIERVSIRTTLGGLCLLFFLFLVPQALAQTPSAPTAPVAPPAEATAKKLTVAVGVFPPLVIQEGDRFTGFEVELWRLIAEELGVEYELVLGGKSVDELLDGVSSGRYDVAMAGITIREDRELRVDFTHQHMHSGLSILVNNKKERSVFGAIFSVLFSSSMIWVLVIGPLFIAGAAGLVWYAERGDDAFDDRFNPGYFQALYWAVVTMSTVGYGDFAPRRPAGRIIAVLIIFTGIALFGTLIAEATSALTAANIEGNIRTSADLSGKTVATKAKSSTPRALEQLGAKVVGLATLEAAFEQLEAGEVDAVVFDMPRIHHYARGEGAGKFMVVGDIFDEQYYGFAVQQQSPLREKINGGLLKLRKNHVYERLHERYFKQEEAAQ